VVQECYGLVLMHYGLRCWLPDAASHADLDPDRLSFSVAVELVQPAVYEFRLVTLEQHAALMQRLVAALGSSLVPPPRLRFSARVVKRPLSCFRRKRYWHRDGSPLKGLSFHEILRI
jgi:hypothetical protein